MKAYRRIIAYLFRHWLVVCPVCHRFAFKLHSRAVTGVYCPTCGTIRTNTDRDIKGA